MLCLGDVVFVDLTIYKWILIKPYQRVPNHNRKIGIDYGPNCLEILGQKLAFWYMGKEAV